MISSLTKSVLWHFILLLISFLLPSPSLAAPASSLQAQGTIDATNTTSASLAPEEFAPAWMPAPTTRGTLTLVFSSVITLFLCIWTTVQVNIEPQTNVNQTIFKLLHIRERRWLAKLLADRSVRKLGWSCVTMIVPEATLAIAAYERRAAYLLRDAMRNSGRPDWTLPLSYYAVMGGFVISDHHHHTNQNTAASGTHRMVTEGDNPLHAEEARNSNSVNKRLTLTPQGVLLVQQHGKLPTITELDVKDKNKASKLTKAIVFFQALWMIVQVIGRTAAELPVTLLELHTCLHTFCALVTYATWWDKPVDVDLATMVVIDSPELLTQLKAPNTCMMTDSPTSHPTATTTTVTQSKENESHSMAVITGFTSPLGANCAGLRYLTSRAGLGKQIYLDLFGDDLSRGYFQMLEHAYERLWKSRSRLWREALAISLVGLIYGGVHLAAWRNTFPTYTERMLWRIASAITASAWSGFVLSLWLGGRSFRSICGLLFGICILPCLLVRLYLLFESFFSIRKLPLKSYDTSVWIQLWPHVG